MYQYTPKGYKYVEQDDIDPEELYTLCFEDEIPQLNPDENELFDDWLSAAEVANYEATKTGKAVSVWQVTPDKRKIAVLLPEGKDKNND